MRWIAVVGTRAPFMRYSSSTRDSMAGATGGALLPKLVRRYVSSAATSVSLIQPNCGIAVPYRPAGIDSGRRPLTTQSANTAGSPSTTGDPARLG